MKELNKTIEELEKKKWGEPESDSHLIKTCHALRKKQLKNFTIEDLRIMLGQNIGNQFLIPLAIQALEKDINAEGDFYPGDLLKSVLKSNTQYWRENSNNWGKVINTLNKQKKTIEDLEDFEDEINFFSQIKTNR